MKVAKSTTPQEVEQLVKLFKESIHQHNKDLKGVENLLSSLEQLVEREIVSTELMDLILEGLDLLADNREESIRILDENIKYLIK